MPFNKGKMMIWKASPLLAALISSMVLAFASAQAVAEQPEQALIRSLSIDSSTKQRLAPSADAVKAFIAEGYANRKPDYRFDYNDYRALRKPAHLFGFSIVILEEEYMAKYVGCCVSPGIGVVLSGRGDLQKLEAFASKNGCSVEAPADPSVIPAEMKLRIPPGKLAYLSCRERDIAQ